MSFAAVVERLRDLENPYPGLRPFEVHGIASCFLGAISRSQNSSAGWNEIASWPCSACRAAASRRSFVPA